jgi:hypothetical protein
MFVFQLSVEMKILPKILIQKLRDSNCYEEIWIFVLNRSEL